MTNVQFNVGPSRDTLRRAMQLLDDMTPVYADIGEYLIDQRRQRFVRGVDPDGNAWKSSPAIPATRAMVLPVPPVNR